MMGQRIIYNIFLIIVAVSCRNSECDIKDKITYSEWENVSKNYLDDLFKRKGYKYTQSETPFLFEKDSIYNNLDIHISFFLQHRKLLLDTLSEMFKKTKLCDFNIIEEYSNDRASYVIKLDSDSLLYFTIHDKIIERALLSKYREKGYNMMFEDDRSPQIDSLELDGHIDYLQLQYHIFKEDNILIYDLIDLTIASS